MGNREALRKQFWERLPQLAPVPADVRGRLASRWLETAQLEHASIASFGRLALQLLGLGAPAVLVEEAHVAALDEIEHARICFALASAYSGRSCGPGRLEAVAESFPTDLATIVCANVDEGCVGETLAALEAREAASRAIDPVVKTALEAIARDEERHAQLGWSLWGWALQATPELRDETEATFRHAVDRARNSPAASDGDVDLEPHGRLTDETRGALVLRNLDEVVEPAKARLFAELDASD